MPGRRVERSATRRSTRLVIIGLVMVAAVVVLAGWITYPLISGSDEGTASGGRPAESGPDRPDAASSPEAEPQERQPSEDGRALRACALQVSQAEDVVQSASRGVSNWSTHVQARTDMLAGRISADTMKARWKRTRLAGPADQERFRAALQEYDATSDCAALEKTGSGAVDPEGECLARAEAATDAVAAAREAMGDWESHLENMAAFAEDAMTAKEAQREWLRAWRDAPGDIGAYHQARDGLTEAPECRSAS